MGEEDAVWDTLIKGHQFVKSITLNMLSTATSPQQRCTTGKVHLGLQMCRKCILEAFFPTQIYKRTIDPIWTLILHVALEFLHRSFYLKVLRRVIHNRIDVWFESIPT